MTRAEQIASAREVKFRRDEAKALARLDKHFKHQDGEGSKSPYYVRGFEGGQVFEYLRYDADAELAARDAVEKRRAKISKAAKARKKK